MRNTEEIARLKTLLRLRKDEYAYFGCTPTDKAQDNSIRNRIKQLEAPR